MTAKILEREDVAQEDKWNTEALFSSLSDWQKEFQKVRSSTGAPFWPELLQYKGKLGEGASKLKKFLVSAKALERRLSKLYTYAHLRHDEDISDERYKKSYAQIEFLYYDFHKEISWVEPEILALPEETIKKYVADSLLADYRTYLERVVRLRAHTLSMEQETLLAQLGKPLSTSAKAFSVFNNADLNFPDVVDRQGNSHPLTHGTFSVYLQSADRILRRNAFQTLHTKFSEFENTLTELLQGQVQVHLFNAKARNYSSCLEAALFPNEIQTNVYKNLIDTVRSRLSALHLYMKVRCELLGIERLHLYDLYAPLVPEAEFSLSYKEAEDLVIESTAPLGDQYQALLRQGLKTDRWVDRFENARKRSGAYSSGCYDSMPYILMNYQGTFRDLTTLSHEVGHSMHTLFSNRNQPYQYSHYPIFLAEIASTFNEELLFHFLLQREQNVHFRRFLINQKLDDIRATFFRQTLFAEFELKVHQLAEEDTPLTPSLLKEEYLALNRLYFGSDVEIDQEIEIEWARIPHFYANFYVYQYATGISAAYALFEKIIQGGQKELDAYLQFLSAGCSRSPLELLRETGIDLSTSHPIESLINRFENLVNELHLIR